MTQPLTADRALGAGGPTADLSAFRRIAAFLTLSVVLGAFGGALTGEKTTFLYKEVMHLTPGDIGTLGILINIPAYLQPFLGAGSDLFPLFGSHRRSYYMLSILVRAGAYWGLACLSQYHYAVVVCLMLALASGGVLSSVMVNAVMVAVGNRTRRLGQLQSLIVFVPAVMSLLYTARLSGYVTQNWSYHHAFGMAALLILLHLPLVLLIDEKPVAAAVNESGLVHPAERRAARLEERAHSAAALREATRSPGLWAVVGLIFYLILTPGINNAQIYYMTDVLHFSKQLIGSLGAYSSAGSIVSMGLFAAFSRRLPVRSLVWYAWGMDCIGYPILVLLHTPDSAKVIYFLGACIGTWYTLCLWTLAARACPPGVEGTIYGLIMSAIAVAGVLSDKIGGSMYDYFGPLNKAHHWTITHGWDYSLWVGLAFTLVGFVFIPFLPAWAKSREPLGGAGEAPRRGGGSPSPGRGKPLAGVEECPVGAPLAAPSFSCRALRGRARQAAPLPGRPLCSSITVGRAGKRDPHPEQPPARLPRHRQSGVRHASSAHRHCHVPVHRHRGQHPPLGTAPRRHAPRPRPP